MTVARRRRCCSPSSIMTLPRSWISVTLGSGSRTPAGEPAGMIELRRGFRSAHANGPRQHEPGLEQVGPVAAAAPGDERVALPQQRERAIKGGVARDQGLAHGSLQARGCTTAVRIVALWAPATRGHHPWRGLPSSRQLRSCNSTPNRLAAASMRRHASSRSASLTPST